MKKIVLLTCFLMFSLASFAQKHEGVVVEIKDTRIDTLISQVQTATIIPVPQATLTSTPNDTPGSLVQVMGYRVQIYTGADRRKAYSQQSKFKDMYPQWNTYITYRKPNYKVRVGDFQTKEQAQVFLNELKPYFPTLFVFNEIVNLYKAEGINYDTTESDTED